MIEVGGGRIFRDVCVDQVKLACVLVRISLSDAGLPLAQHLHLGALQNDPRLQRVLDQVIMACSPILGDMSVGGAHQLRRPALRIARCTFSCVSGRIAHNGCRTSGVQRPSRDAAYLTGAGLVSANSASCSGIRR